MAQKSPLIPYLHCMIRYIVIAISVILTCSMFDMRAQSLDVLLDRAERNLTKSPVKVRFQSTQYSAQGKVLAIANGTMHIKGERFRLEYGHITAVFTDGTLSYYDSESREFTITEPTQEDLSMLNPFYILKRRTKGYQVTSLASKSVNSRGIRLSSQAKSAVRHLDVFMASDTGIPQLINIYISDGTRSEIKITSFNTRPVVDSNLFSLSSKSYPGCEIVDLR